MHKSISIIISILVLTACSHLPKPDPWTKREKIALAVLIGAEATSTCQVIEGNKPNNGVHEMNGVYKNKQPEQVIFTKAAGTAFIGGVAHFFFKNESGWINREQFLGACAFTAGIFIMKDFDVLSR